MLSFTPTLFSDDLVRVLFCHSPRAASMQGDTPSKDDPDDSSEDDGSDDENEGEGQGTFAGRGQDANDDEVEDDEDQDDEDDNMEVFPPCCKTCANDTQFTQVQAIARAFFLRHCSIITTVVCDMMPCFQSDEDESEEENAEEEDAAVKENGKPVQPVAAKDGKRGPPEPSAAPAQKRCGLGHLC